MQKEVLTLVRELQIVREENILLKDRNIKLKERERSFKAYKTLIYKMVKFLSFIAKGHNVKIAASAQYLIDENARIREDNGEKPLEIVLYKKPEPKTELEPEAAIK